VTASSVVLDDALNPTTGLGVHSRICQGLLAFVTGEFNASEKSKGFRVVEGVQRPRNDARTLHASDDYEIASFFGLEVGSLVENRDNLSSRDGADYDAGRVSSDVLGHDASPHIHPRISVRSPNVNLHLDVSEVVTRRRGHWGRRLGVRYVGMNYGHRYLALGRLRDATSAHGVVDFHFGHDESSGRVEC